MPTLLYGASFRSLLSYLYAITFPRYQVCRILDEVESNVQCMNDIEKAEEQKALYLLRQLFIMGYPSHQRQQRELWTDRLIYRTVLL